MHVRMAHARLVESGAEVVAQALASPTKEERQQYRCWFCPDIPVLFVSGGRTKNGVLVRSHFRRHPDYSDHHPTCGFDFEAQLASWGGRAAEVVSQSKRKLILSLNHLMSAYAPQPTTTASGGETVGATGAVSIPAREVAVKQTPQQRAHAERLARMTCRAARELWHLARIAETDASVKNRVILRLESRTIDWPEFFFRHDVPGDLARLARMIQQQEELPVCVIGKVHSVHSGLLPKSGKSPYDRIELVWEQIPRGPRFAVRIATRRRGVVSQFKPQDEVVVTGKLMRQINQPVILSGRDKYHAWLWLDLPEQISLRDDGGSASSPEKSHE